MSKSFESKYLKWILFNLKTDQSIISESAMSALANNYDEQIISALEQANLRIIECIEQIEIAYDIKKAGE